MHLTLSYNERTTQTDALFLQLLHIGRTADQAGQLDEAQQLEGQQPSGQEEQQKQRLKGRIQQLSSVDTDSTWEESSPSSCSSADKQERTMRHELHAHEPHDSVVRAQTARTTEGALGDESSSLKALAGGDDGKLVGRVSLDGGGAKMESAGFQAQRARRGRREQQQQVAASGCHPSSLVHEPSAAVLAVDGASASTCGPALACGARAVSGAASSSCDQNNNLCAVVAASEWEKNEPQQAAKKYSLAEHTTRDSGGQKGDEQREEQRRQARENKAPEGNKLQALELERKTEAADDDGEKHNKLTSESTAAQHQSASGHPFATGDQLEDVKMRLEQGGKKGEEFAQDYGQRRRDELGRIHLAENSNLSASIGRQKSSGNNNNNNNNNSYKKIRSNNVQETLTPFDKAASLNERAFKFNQNLPSPMQIKSEATRGDKRGPWQDEWSVGELGEPEAGENGAPSGPSEKQQEASNRLSVYENVESESGVGVAPAGAQLSSETRERAQRGEVRDAPQTRAGHESEPERDERQRPKPKLVTMTSLIHEPEDDLMNQQVASSLAEPTDEEQQRQQTDSQQQGARRASRRESNFSNGDNSNNNNSDSDSSSMAACVSSKRRLVRKFEQLASGHPRPGASAKQGASNGAQGAHRDKPPLPPKAGGGGSLVKRLARNFDQQQQETSPRASLGNGAGRRAGGQQFAAGQQQSTSGANGGAIVAQKVAVQLVSSELEEPKSDSTWYDAKSVELLDEAEVAELLREFDSDNDFSDKALAEAHRRPASANREPEDEDATTIEGEPTLDDDQEGRNLSSSLANLDLLDEESSLTYASAAANLNSSNNDTSCRSPSLQSRPQKQGNNLRGEQERGLSEEKCGAQIVVPQQTHTPAQPQVEQDVNNGPERRHASSRLTRSNQLEHAQHDCPAHSPQGDQRQWEAWPASDQTAAAGSTTPTLAAGPCERDAAELFTSEPCHSPPPPPPAPSLEEQHHHHHHHDHHQQPKNVLSPANDQQYNHDYHDQNIHNSNRQNDPLHLDHPEAQATISRIDTANNNNSAINDQLFKSNLEKLIPNIHSHHQQSPNYSTISSPTSKISPITQSSNNSRQQRLPSTSSSSSKEVAPGASPVKGEQATIRRAESAENNPSELSAPKRDSGHYRTKSRVKRKRRSRRERVTNELARYYRFVTNMTISSSSPRGNETPSRRSSSRASSNKAKLDDYIHSSSDEDDDDSSADEFGQDDSSDNCSDYEDAASESCTTANSTMEQLDTKNLVKAAKKCSKLYDELERLLAKRVEESRKQRSVTGGHDLEESTESISSLSATNSSLPLHQRSHSLLPPSSTLNEDRISLSSSSISSESMPEIKQRQNLQKLYNIVNEIYTSEAKFVDTLRLLNVDLRNHINNQSVSSGSPGNSHPHSVTSSEHSNGNNNGQQPFDCIQRMLRHLPQLQALNENLLDELKQARDAWPKTQKISHILVKLGPFLKHYSSYIRDFESAQIEFNENLKKYPKFNEIIKQFEASERCQKLSVQHHLLKPIQRIPQYRLLLQQYLHHLKPDDQDYEDTVNALEVVSRVAEHANQSMNDGINFAKLLALQAKIVAKQRDIIQPGRFFIKEGELVKVSRKSSQPRWFVLLNDALLYLGQIQSSDILYLKYELALNQNCQVLTPNERVSSQNLIGRQFETEFSICTPARSFTLIAKTRQERDDWVQCLRKAIEDHVTKQRSFSSVGGTTSGVSPQASNNTQPTTMVTNHHHQLPGNASNNAANPNGSFLLGAQAPLWTPDSRVSMCQLCTSDFSALFRRHHCRACGRVICSACSSNKAPLIYLKCRSARVCDQCFDTLKANMHLYYLPSSRCQLIGQINERELKRLDEHFKTLLKSQFLKHTGFERIKRGAAQQLHRNQLEKSSSSTSSLSVSLSNKSLDGAKSGASKTTEPLICGHLHKRHPKKPKWKRQWFVIRDNVLMTYRAIDDVAPINSMCLLGYAVDQPRVPIDGLEANCLIRLKHHSLPTVSSSSVLSLSSCSNLSDDVRFNAGKGDDCSKKGSKVELDHLFRAEDQQAASRWMEAFRQSVKIGLN